MENIARVIILPVPGIVEYRDHHLVMICVLTKTEISTIITVSGILERVNDILSNVLNTESTSQGGKKRGVREETLKKCQSGNGFKNTKKISFDAPFSCDSENHNRNLIELRERWEKIVL